MTCALFLFPTKMAFLSEISNTLFSSRHFIDQVLQFFAAVKFHYDLPAVCLALQVHLSAERGSKFVLEFAYLRIQGGVFAFFAHALCQGSLANAVFHFSDAHIF